MSHDVLGVHGALISRKADVDRLFDGVRLEEDSAISAAKRPLTVVIPQSGDDVGHDQVRRVLGDQLQDEDAVLAQVRLREGDGRLAVAVTVAVVAVGDLEVSADVDESTVSERDRPQPASNADDSDAGDTDQPEPHERIDLLVEQVDRQHALDRVPVNGAHLPDTEVAERHSGEPAKHDAVGGSGGRPTDAPDSAAGRQVDQHLDAVRAVVGRQERVEQEDLSDGVGEVQQLGDDVQQEQVVAVAIATDEARAASQARLDAGAETTTVVALVLQVVVEVSDHVLDGLVAPLRVQRVLDRVGRLDEIVDVDAGPLAEQTPEDARQIEEKRLDEKENGNPLIIAEVLLDGTWLAGNRVIWQVVGVRHPAYLVCILHISHTHTIN